VDGAGSRGILANSRPYEGCCYRSPWCVPSYGGPSPGRGRPHPFCSDAQWRRAALLLMVAAMAAYYNHRVFGNAFTLPYQVNRATYASAPVFLWQQPGPSPFTGTSVMREFYSKWEMGDFLYARTLAGFLHATAQKLERCCSSSSA